MFGVFPIATPLFADAIGPSGQHVKRLVRVLNIPCETRSCAVEFPPDIETYSLQDALTFNQSLSFLVTCPPGRTCPPGTYPRVITFPPGTFVIPDPRVNPGFPITIQLTGCQSTVSRVLPSTATNAEINAAAQEVIQEVARQQAECDSIVNPPVPNPSPFFSNVETYASVPCEECEALVYDGILPWYISVDNENNRLVLATGVITAATQELADQQAQEFLNNFKAAADAAGKLLCETCIISTASPLPNGEVNTAYSQTLTATGTVDTPSWSVVSGTLPDGLSLNSATGEISGTPMTEQTATFTIKCETGLQCCEKEFTLEVQSVDCPDWDDIVWGTPVESYAGTGSGSITLTPPSQFDVQVTATAFNPNFAQIVVDGEITYDGSGCNCQIEIAISNTGGTVGAGWIQITSPTFGSIAFGQWFTLGVGSHNVPFSIPDTGGVPEVLTVQIVAQKIWDSTFGTMQCTGTISNV